MVRTIFLSPYPVFDKFFNDPILLQYHWILFLIAFSYLIQPDAISIIPYSQLNIYLCYYVIDR